MKIVVGSDHAGFQYKSKIIGFVKSMGHSVEDIGADSDESTDYPDFAEKGSKIVACGEADMAIFLCGSGIGMDIVANKIKGIRSAVCWNKETAMLARSHNHANVLSLGKRLLTLDECLEIVKVFLNTPESMEERHLKRIKKIKDIEERSQNCDG
jgi:ribose 5-phosphate isomerase B